MASVMASLFSLFLRFYLPLLRGLGGSHAPHDQAVYLAPNEVRWLAYTTLAKFWRQEYDRGG